MAKDLRDFALARQNELTRTLAGCACVDPTHVVELVRKLRPDDITDEHARKFLLALTPDADPLETARTTGTIREYPEWLGIATDRLFELHAAATAAVDEIKRLVVMRQALNELSTWLAEAREKGRHL